MGTTRSVTLLVGLTVVVAAGALLQDFRFDSAIMRERATGLSTDREFGSLSVMLADLRGSQSAYFANTDFWTGQVNTLSGDVESVIRRRRAASTQDAARKNYDAAAAALGSFVAVDGRARGFLRANDSSAAADLIFKESFQAIQNVANALDAARAAEMAAANDRLSRIRTLRLSVNGIAIAFVLAVALFFWRSAAPAPSAEPEPVVVAAPPPAPVRVGPPPAHSVPGLNLADAAALCGDLAKVMDTREVPPLFERAALILAAKGAVLWVADPGGSLLRPSLTHGYSDRVVAKLGSLTIDADNLTSLAYRTLRSQTVNGDAPASPGAIAVPLLGASGCVGVLAAETLNQKPAHDVLPVAQMIAAQLAALVAPPAAQGQKTG